MTKRRQRWDWEDADDEQRTGRTADKLNKKRTANCFYFNTEENEGEEIPPKIELQEETQ